MVTASVDTVRGDTTGLEIPAHAEALRTLGEAFLTGAFQTFGSLAPTNRVSKIIRFEPCAGGSTGHKLFLSVEYERPEPGLHANLFVKFSRDFADPRRDHGRYEMEPEARFAAISRLPGFPIAVPAVYFADYHHESGTGLVITERIPFGHEGIEPHRRKCLDYLLDDPLPYYRALVTALARLAGAHKSGMLAAAIEERFPYDAARAATDPILYTEDELSEALDSCARFAERCPQLLPPAVRSAEFQERMRREAFRFRDHEALIRSFLRSDRDLIALCHWNAHIDNAWFSCDPSGKLQCGLFDWGRVSQITIAAALWGCLSAAHHVIWERHLDGLLALFVAEYEEHGGPSIEAEELKLHLMLHAATMGVARILAFPDNVLFRLPEAINASGPHDPMFLGSDSARNTLHIYTVLLNLWVTGAFGASLDRLLARLDSSS